MAPSTQVFLEGVLTFGVPLLLAAHELVALRRAGRGSGGFDGPRDASPAPLLPGHQPHSPPLPACLLAAARTDAVAGPTADRRRVLEPV